MKYKPVIFWGGLLILLNLSKSRFGLFAFGDQSLLAKIFYLGQILLAVCYLGWLIIDIKNNGYFVSLAKRIKQVPVPRAPKIIFGMILLISLVHVFVGVTIYPFENVAMFARPLPRKDFPPKLTLPRYFYKDKSGQVQVIKLKSYNLLLAGWSFDGIDAEYTSPTLFHYKSHEKNFEFLKSVLAEKGITDSLWVGLHEVNFETQIVQFNSNIKDALNYMDTATFKISYGYSPDYIFVPKYQYNRLNEKTP